MDAVELFDMVASNYSNEDLIDIIQGLMSNIGKCEFSLDLLRELKDYCEERNICPYCGECLKCETVVEDTLEYFGTPCYKMIIVDKCDGCGFYFD